MPQNKREGLIYTVLMCQVMVFWMSLYNVGLHSGELSLHTLREAWLAFPFACIYALLFDWFVVGKMAKDFAFKYLLKATSQEKEKVLIISCCMVMPMVVVMSLFGGLEVSLKTGQWSLLPIIWLSNIPKNLVMALPFQLIIAGPLVRKIFRRLFPVGKVLA